MPNVVKGSKQRRMKVVPHRPHGRKWLLVLACLSIGVAGLTGYVYGYKAGEQGRSASNQDLNRLTTDLAAMEDENANLQRRLAVVERASLIDRQTAQELQAAIAAQRERITQLERETAHYRQVVAEDISHTGLVIGDFDIDPTADPGRFKYKLVVRQRDADGDTFLEGHVNVRIFGRQDDEEMLFPLSELSDTESEVDIELNFRYFQSIEGELSLPDSFIPEKVHITAVSTDPVPKEVNEDISWNAALGN